MKKANIIFISWDHSYLIEREKHMLIRIFREKYGAENIESCPLDATDAYARYHDHIASVGLFQEKRMFVFFGGRSKKPTKNDAPGFEHFLDRLLPLLSDEDFLLFFDLTPHEIELKKWLNSHASIREQRFSWATKDWEKYTHLSSPSLARVLAAYQAQEKWREKWQENPLLWHTIFHSLTQLAILEQAGVTITDELIAEFSHGYEGGKNFDFVDAIMAENIEKALLSLDRIKNTIDQNSIDMFIASLLGILRKNLFVVRLRDAGMTREHIASTLTGMSPYMLTKAYNSRISAEKLWHFFEKIVTTNIAYKRGKWMKKNVLWRFLEIDTALFALKK